METIEEQKPLITHRHANVLDGKLEPMEIVTGVSNGFGVCKLPLFLHEFIKMAIRQIYTNELIFFYGFPWIIYYVDK